MTDDVWLLIVIGFGVGIIVGLLIAHTFLKDNFDWWKYGV